MKLSLFYIYIDEGRQQKENSVREDGKNKSKLNSGNSSYSLLQKLYAVLVSYLGAQY